MNKTKKKKPMVAVPTSNVLNASEQYTRAMHEYFQEIQANGNSIKAKALRDEKVSLWHSLTRDEREVLRNMEDNLRQTHGAK